MWERGPEERGGVSWFFTPRNLNLIGVEWEREGDIYKTPEPYGYGPSLCTCEREIRKERGVPWFSELRILILIGIAQAYVHVHKLGPH